MRKAAVSACLVFATLFALPTAAGAQGGDPPGPKKFEKVTLNDRPGEPVSLAVLPDRRVLHTARGGQVRLFDPRTQLNTLAADVDVYSHDEEGLQGIAIDPNFENNRWVYLYYSPPGDTPEDDPTTPIFNEGDAPFESDDPSVFDDFKGALRLSRFKLEAGKLNMGTEQKIIDVPVDRGICCHVGGQIDFDPQGNLYLSTGDDSNPFESDGYCAARRPPEPQPGVRRAPHGRQHERPARQAAADPAEGRRRLRHPAGQPVRPRHAEDEARDLPDGPPQPVPVRGQRHERRRLHGGLLAGRRRGRSGPRPRGSGALDARAQAGQLRLALLRDAGHPVRRLRLRDGDVGRAVQLRPARQRLAAQHRAARAAAGRAAGRLVLVQPRGHAVPGAVGERLRQRHLADGRPGIRVRQEQPVDVQVAEVLRRPAAVLRVEP